MYRVLKMSDPQAKARALKQLPAFLLISITASCGGGKGNTDDAHSSNTSHLNLNGIESTLQTSQVDTAQLDGVWLLAQEQNYQFSDSDTNSLSSGTTHLLRTDIVSLQKNNGILQFYYCSNLQQLMFETVVIDNSYFRLQGDGYYFPSNETYTGTITGNGAIIEFSPSQFSHTSNTGSHSRTESGQTNIKAYKLRDGFENDSIGSWRRTDTSELINCGTYEEKQTRGSYTDDPNTQVSIEEKRVSFKTEHIIVNMSERFSDGLFSRMLITETNENSVSTTEHSSGSYQFTTSTPLIYEGEYTIEGMETARFTIDLTH